MELLTFQQAIIGSSKHRRHVLLGNGFSIACKPDTFMYGRLFEQADFSELSTSARKVFDALETEDFEKIINVLNNSNQVLNIYNGTTKEKIDLITGDAVALKEVLVQTLAVSHPSNPNELSKEQYQHCKIFLGNFSRIYTLTYDLLLYWVCMHCEEGEEPSCDDGFRKPYENYDAPYVTWEPQNSHQQSMFFLHGALHLFDAGYELRKFTWVNTNVRLIDQIRKAMDESLFPVFVSEGTSKEKIEKIRHNDYLAKSYRSFVEISGALFIYGHSLAENDEHFLTSIEKGKIK